MSKDPFTQFQTRLDAMQRASDRRADEAYRRFMARPKPTLPRHARNKPANC